MVAVPAAGSEALLGEILERVALPEDGFASAYVETRESRLLSGERRITGRIRYRPPGSLRKTEEGGDARRVIVIDAGTVRIEDAEGTRRFALERSRELGALMALLGALAAGDAAALHEHFRVEATGTPGDWTLRLAARAGDANARDADAAQPLRLRVLGHTGRIHRIVFLSPRSGRITLRLEPDEA